MAELEVITFERSDNGVAFDIGIAPGSKFVDLKDVAEACGLNVTKLKLIVADDEKKRYVSLELARTRVESLYKLCKVDKTSPLVVFVDDPVAFRFIIAKKRRSFPIRPTLEVVLQWVEDQNEELVGQEFSLRLTCGENPILDVTSQREFDAAVDNYLQAEQRAHPVLKELEITLTVQKGPAKSYSKYVGDKGVEEAMRKLLGGDWDIDNPSHSLPQQVEKLDEFPPFDLAPHLLRTLPPEYSAGQADNIDGAITSTLRYLAAVLAACRLSSSQNEATRRAFIDPILVLICTIVAALRKLTPGHLQLCMEYAVEEASNTGKIDYVIRLLMTLLSLIEAKGEGALTTFRGQTLVELAALKASNIAEGKKRNWDETQAPGTAVLTNSLTWEFYVYRPHADPPVVFREIGTPIELLWKDLPKLRERFMPVIEQLVGIVLAEVDRISEHQAAKRSKVES